MEYWEFYPPPTFDQFYPKKIEYYNWKNAFSQSKSDFFGTFFFNGICSFFWPQDLKTKTNGICSFFVPQKLKKKFSAGFVVFLNIWWGVCLGDGLGATKTRLFGKKSGGTPNPQVKKLGGTPNPDQIFASAAASRGGGRPRREANPLFLPKSRVFVAPSPSPRHTPTKKLGNI